MASNEKRALIIEYWFRISLKGYKSYSIENISNVIINFAIEFETFDPSLIHSLLTLNDNKSIVSLVRGNGWANSAFGTTLAISGRKYHWKIKILTDTEDINIGIIEATELNDDPRFDNYWWCKQYGYTYYANDGTKWNNSDDCEYGDKYGGKDDIIHVYLDLKDNITLSFAKNEKKFGKAFDLIDGIDYKLGVSLLESGAKVELLALSVTY